jgi:hypothetical protein
LTFTEARLWVTIASGSVVTVVVLRVEPLEALKALPAEGLVVAARAVPVPAPRRATTTAVVKLAVSLGARTRRLALSAVRRMALDILSSA